MGPIADNGGLTWTHLPLAGSPAIDNGNAQCYDTGGSLLSEDQRGLPRPVDGDANDSIRCDIGAVEVQPGEGGYRVYLPLIER